MLVVHGLWLPTGHLGLWAEDPTVRTRRTRRHPFAAPPEAIAAALGEAAAKGSAGIATLQLPTAGGRPLDSPELVRTDPPPRRSAEVALAPWLVPTLELEPDAALALLRGPDDRVAHGSSLRHAAQVAAFAADLVRRGRVLPVVAEGAAAWRPLLTGADAAWARALAAALPPSGRAAGGNPGTLVGGALDALVDAAARTALAGVRLAGGRGTVSGSWLGALSGRERRVDAAPAELAALADAVAQWQRDAAGGAVRACFRLVEPDEEQTQDWRVDFSLQAADEPSLVVDAEKVWRSRGALRALARHLDAPQETLLTELGRASRLWPELDDALRTAKPSTLALDVTGAHRFLREGAPLLHAAGFGVLLPTWWGRPGARLGAKLRARGGRTAPGTVATASAVGMRSLVDYEWEVALGDEPLSEKELRELAKLKTPLVRLRGRWVELDAKHLAAGLKLLKSGGEMSVGELLHLGLSMEDDPGALPIQAVTADGPLGDLLAGEAERHLAPVDPPAAFAGTLRPYQKRGLAWLTFLQSLGLGGILADDMGLGKTIQLIALMAGDGPEVGPTLLVCPMSLVGNWEREAAKFAPGLRVHVHHGAERARGAEFAAAVRDADVVVTTYSVAARDAEALGEIAWHRVVVDEAQAIKNAATRQAAAVRALPARHRVAVTGTPVENRLADLWSIMDFANPGLLGAAAAFKKRYAEPVERHGDEEAAARLRRITGPFVLRRLKTDKTIISDLPDKLEMEVLCNLTGEQASLYQAVVDDMIAKIERSDGIERRGLVLATMSKLKQVCNHPAQFLHDDTRLAGRSGKLARLEEILEEVLAAGERALLFTQYAEFGGMLRAHLSARYGREVLFLHGGVSKKDRDAMVARFQGRPADPGQDGSGQGPGGPPLFVLSLKAGGTGLTLTAANHVVHVDRWWNPAVEDQATDRAFRIGQRRAVQVRKFVCAGTVEEKIAGMIRDKRGLAAKIVGTGEQWLTSLSTAQLRDLFALEAGAVVE
ncbi:DEAD/DEAH box helicase [Phytohabitans sp. ZYX-F-186]|uniref:DEAD/DEAH box helicase n=1 Tax=Phytohabitans maris TaxID=3071409 RepID=A0ABU0ZP87_9ACTN|nr:DEAD/DEAH box helicase [Phytohabitans sp. ZYX-F-186]MDQ7908846.1 DEAD/DEAH box helicase [Phytohabitans sp. ZYX-F-186]